MPKTVKLMPVPLTTLQKGDSAKILKLDGGRQFLTKLRSMGVRETKILKIVALHPFGGPVVIEIDGRDVTIGRGIAERILVKVLD
jgi:ferrous iron transport protein A